ncbi:MAG TPA: methyltransferase domain-containing protein [Candidatus Krumholzibacteria bacterium]|nr:methyltransferase domain-containing protein [Candidatus Krumholzibacteria bacterium]
MSGDWFKIAFGELYPLVYPHRDVAEAARVASRLAPIVASSRPVLDVACGDGRYMSALAAAGVDVYGVDLSEYLLGEAVKRAGLAGRLVCGDMRVLPFLSGAFGAAINMFTSFGYFDSDADNVRVLGEIERVLARRGVFVLDFLNAVVVRSGIKPHTRRTVKDAEVDETRALSHDGHVLTKRVHVRCPGREPVEYVERVRLYTRDELRALVTGAGFDVSAEHGDYDLGAFDAASSPRLVLVNRKRSDA